MSLLDANVSKPLTGGPSYGIGHRLSRMAWSITWRLLASWTPTPFHAWRRFLLRSFGAKIGKGAHVYSSATIWYPANLTMEAHACLGPRVNCYSMSTIVLKKGAIISQGAYLCGGTHDVDDPQFQLLVAPISIGEDAWVAAEAFIGPGVTVGDRAVIGARCVLFKDADANTIYVGNPARAVRQRKSHG